MANAAWQSVLRYKRTPINAFYTPQVSVLLQDTYFSAATPPATSRLKVWTGSAWVAKPVNVWTGSAWVEKPIKFWNGSAWA